MDGHEPGPAHPCRRGAWRRPGPDPAVMDMDRHFRDHLRGRPERGCASAGGTAGVRFRRQGGLRHGSALPHGDSSLSRQFALRGVAGRVGLVPFPGHADPPGCGDGSGAAFSGRCLFPSAVEYRDESHPGGRRSQLHRHPLLGRRHRTGTQGRSGGAGHPGRLRLLRRRVRSGRVGHPVRPAGHHGPGL